MRRAKLTVPQLVKKYSAFYVTRRFITGRKHNMRSWGKEVLLHPKQCLKLLPPTPPPSKVGRGSSVGIETDYGLDGPGSNPGGDEIFRPSRPALGSTQSPAKWVPGSFPGVKCGRDVLLTTHPLLVPRSWKSRAIPLPTLWATPGL